MVEGLKTQILNSVFSGINLSGSSFDNVNLSNTDFSNSNLTGVISEGQI